MRSPVIFMLNMATNARDVPSPVIKHTAFYSELCVDGAVYFYPLAVGNLLAAVMNLAESLGIPKVNGQVVMNV